MCNSHSSGRACCNSRVAGGMKTSNGPTLPILALVRVSQWHFHFLPVQGEHVLRQREPLRVEVLGLNIFSGEAPVGLVASESSAASCSSWKDSISGNSLASSFQELRIHQRFVGHVLEHTATFISETRAEAWPKRPECPSPGTGGFAREERLVREPSYTNREVLAMTEWLQGLHERQDIVIDVFLKILHDTVLEYLHVRLQFLNRLQESSLCLDGELHCRATSVESGTVSLVAAYVWRLSLR